MLPTREWTVMFFLATDNPLASGAVAQLKAMKSAGYHPEVNVIAQYDPNQEGMPVHIFEVNKMEKRMNPNTVNIGFGVNDSLVRNLLADKLWTRQVNDSVQESLQGHFRFEAPAPTKTMSEDRNPKESLERFLNFCRRKYPARHYILFLIGHGMAVGDDLFLFDEHGSVKKGDSQPRSLLLKDLGQILENFKTHEQGKGKLELVAFHSCSMSGVEVASELKNKARYMLASQGTSYLNSYPYRQILIRLFSETSLPWFPQAEVKTNGFSETLKTKNGKAKAKLAAGSALRHSGLSQVGVLQQVVQYEESGLEDLTKQKKTGTNGNHLKIGQPITELDLKTLMISIFQRCLYNSYDFQLAGYSSDLTLCDLKQVGKLEKQVANLVKVLREGLKSAADDPVLTDRLLLAHLEAQSFYEEKYTDLYDFCLRLRARCHGARSKKVDLKAISDACYEVMQVLKRGAPGDDFGIIVRSEFNGAASQYAHGFSIFFPWSKPIGSSVWDDQYKNFQFAETGWARFLNDYFDSTMRKPQHIEEDPFKTCLLPEDVDERVLSILEQTHSAVFPGEKQVQSKAKDSLGLPIKSGSQDPQGSDCDCGSIKNYPPLTPDPGSRDKWKKKGWIGKGWVSRPVANLYSSYRRFFRLDEKPTSRL